ncbi:MAG: hypothetical protein JNM17_14700 [Archangium sp.]|nr:hypothetical protein [Archangium sp.]
MHLIFVAMSVLAQVDPPPPSTGNEMPRAQLKQRLPTRTEADAEFSNLLFAAKEADRDCSTIITPRTRLLLVLSRPTLDAVDRNIEGYLQLARCAEKQKYFALLRDLGQMMVKARGEEGHPELLARAFLGLNAPDAALKVLEVSGERAPDDPELALTAAKIYCRTRDWTKCLESAEKTVKLVKKPNSPEGKQTLNRAHKYRARVFLHTGKFDLANKAIALSEKLGGDAEDLGEVRKAMVPAKQFKVVVEVEHQGQVPLGIYHLMGKKAADGLVTVYLANVGDDRQFRVEVNIDGVTTPITQMETVLKGQPMTFELTPRLASSFDVLSLATPRPAQLDLKVVAISSKGEQVVFQKSAPIELQPRDYLPTATWLDEEKALAENHFNYMAAWVTPNTRAVEAFLTEAKSRAPRNTFSGEQSATIPQVRAIYDTLKARGVSYVMNPEMLDGTGFGQRARLPNDVLASTNAQCLEGAILYATLLEAIGLQPAIIIVPGHAFVGWKATAGDVEVASAWTPPVVAAPPAAGPAEVSDVDGGVPQAPPPDTDAGVPSDGGTVAVATAKPAVVDAGSKTPVMPNPFTRAKTAKWLFLETTMTHDASYDAAVLIGGREYDGATFYGRAKVLMVPELRRLGIAPQPF